MSCCALGTELSQNIRVKRGGLTLRAAEAAEAAEAVTGAPGAETPFWRRRRFEFLPRGPPPPPPPPPRADIDVWQVGLVLYPGR